MPDLFGQSGQIVARRRRPRRRKSSKHFDQEVDGIRRLRLNRRRRTPGGDGCYLSSSFRRRKKDMRPGPNVVKKLRP